MQERCSKWNGNPSPDPEEGGLFWKKKKKELKKKALFFPQEKALPSVRSTPAPSTHSPMHHGADNPLPEVLGMKQ